MKNKAKWKPTKYVYKKDKLIASRDPAELAIHSRLIADITARNYQEVLGSHAHGMLLDLGCGKVPFYGAYKKLIQDNTCVDWENSLHHNEFLDFHCDLTKDFSFRDEEFNTIILSDVLEHIPEPQNLWNEMARILSVDGVIIMNVPFIYFLHEQPHDYYRYTEYSLRRFVKLAGLELIELHAIGGVPEILADIIAKTIIAIPIIGSSLSMFIQWITSVFVKVGIGKRISSLTSKRFPLGYMLVAKKSSG